MVLCFPHNPPGQTSSSVSPSLGLHVFGWLLMWNMWRPYKATMCFIFVIFFVTHFDGPNNTTTPHPSLFAQLDVTPTSIHCCCLLLAGCCVSPLYDGHAMAAVIFSLIFLSLNMPPQLTKNVPPTRSIPVASLFKRPLPPRMPSSNWLLHF